MLPDGTPRQVPEDITRSKFAWVVGVGNYPSGKRLELTEKGIIGTDLNPVFLRHSPKVEFGWSNSDAFGPKIEFTIDAESEPVACIDGNWIFVGGEHDWDKNDVVGDLNTIIEKRIFSLATPPRQEDIENIFAGQQAKLDELNADIESRVQSAGGIHNIVNADRIRKTAGTVLLTADKLNSFMTSDNLKRAFDRPSEDFYKDNEGLWMVYPGDRSSMASERICVPVERIGSKWIVKIGKVTDSGIVLEEKDVSYSISRFKPEVLPQASSSKCQVWSEALQSLTTAQIPTLDVLRYVTNAEIKYNHKKGDEIPWPDKFVIENNRFSNYSHWIYAGQRLLELGYKPIVFQESKSAEKRFVFVKPAKVEDYAKMIMENDDRVKEARYESAGNTLRIVVKSSDFISQYQEKTYLLEVDRAEDRGSITDEMSRQLGCKVVVSAEKAATQEKAESTTTIEQLLRDNSKARAQIYAELFQREFPSRKADESDRLYRELSKLNGREFTLKSAAIALIQTLQRLESPSPPETPLDPNEINTLFGQLSQIVDVLFNENSHFAYNLRGDKQLLQTLTQTDRDNPDEIFRILPELNRRRIHPTLFTETRNISRGGRIEPPRGYRRLLETGTADRRSLLFGRTNGRVQPERFLQMLISNKSLFPKGKMIGKIEGNRLVMYVDWKYSHHWLGGEEGKSNFKWRINSMKQVIDGSRVDFEEMFQCALTGDTPFDGLVIRHKQNPQFNTLKQMFLSEVQAKRLAESSGQLTYRASPDSAGMAAIMAADSESSRYRSGTMPSEFWWFPQRDKVWFDEWEARFRKFEETGKIE